MPFQLDQLSTQRLVGVHRDLVKVVDLATQIFDGVFVVTEGMRSQARQDELVAKGFSRTRNSRHLTGHAVDLTVKEGKKVVWDWEHYFALARAMQQSAEHHQVPLRWGGFWSSLIGVPDLRRAQLEYIARFLAKYGEERKPLLDGPHYELPRDLYP